MPSSVLKKSLSELLYLLVPLTESMQGLCQCFRFFRVRALLSRRVHRASVGTHTAMTPSMRVWLHLTLQQGFQLLDTLVPELLQHLAAFLLNK